ncbi:MAG: NTP transferase domain-containing protein [Candidatus Nitronauta litoralis]|uniref:NTP transferase domain-containing protein n=1 Tax=Candidatus Nitronauta litoralis TaxID=2705533 RepID=A0A7T0BWI7_9BACT|nr:MAG: NTP transferase domain-containing protein [Candidatus Nitronauta litoralis]
MEPLIIIQARMGATRLPGKVLLDLCGKSVLHHVVERVQACPKVKNIVVATTVNENDDAIEKETRNIGISCFRGSETDVLDRYYQTTQTFSGDPVVRITADCPLLDPELLTSMLKTYENLSSSKNLLYLSNVQERTFPRGLDIEIFNRDALILAWEKAEAPEEREHVTPYIHRNPERFSLHNFSQTKDLSQLRWTLDTPDDLILIREIYEALYNEKVGAIFSTRDVLDLLEKNPELKTLNAHIQQKAH